MIFQACIVASFLLGFLAQWILSDKDVGRKLFDRGVAFGARTTLDVVRPVLHFEDKDTRESIYKSLRALGVGEESND